LQPPIRFDVENYRTEGAQALPRSTHHHRAKAVPAKILRLMTHIDERYMQHPFHDPRQMKPALHRPGHEVARRRVSRLIRLMGLEAIYRKPNLSRANAAHPVHPFVLRGLVVGRPNQVWATDVTYIPVQGGFAYLCAVIDWHSRWVLAWELSKTLDAAFCMRVLKRAPALHGTPEIFNTDQGCQFTSAEFTGVLKGRGVKISMDGQGRCLDNVFVEWLWRSAKNEEVYLKAYADLVDAERNLRACFLFYNNHRPHSAHDGSTPSEFNRPIIEPRQAA
jgi:putative transposase